MNCKKCDKALNEFTAVFDDTTFTLYCMDCLPEGKPLRQMQDTLKEYYPEVFKLTTKVASTRLELDNLLYVLKFAQVHETGNMSSTLNAIVERLRKLEELDHIALDAVPFSKKYARPKQEYNTLAFLKPKPGVEAKPAKHRTERLEIEKPEPDRDIDPDKGGLFII